ncbi:MAG: HEAT repeat domain-containing protein [Terriglobia bacterium]
MKHLIRNQIVIFLTALCVCLWLALSRSRAVVAPSFAQSASGSPSSLDPSVVSTLQTLLRSPRPDVRASAFDWMSRDPRAQASAFIPQIFAALKDSDGNVRDKALSNVGWILTRYHGAAPGDAAIAAVEDALRQTTDRAAQLIALDLIGGSGQGGVYSDVAANHENPFLISDPAIRKMLISTLKNPESSLRPQLLSLVSGSESLRSDPSVIEAAAAALEADDLSVRNQAIRLMVKVYAEGRGSLAANTKPMLEAALKTDDPNVRLQAARALGVPVPPAPPAVRLVSLTGARVSMADVPFNFNYFTAFVQPLFVKKYGATACVDCHASASSSYGEFRLLRPGPGGHFTLAQSRVNFVSALAVINRKDPMRSKLLLKPLDPNTREGTIRGMTHDGGVFWHNQYDPDFEIVVDWLKGAKLEDRPGKQLSFAYFKTNVEPIFSTPGPDGFACITCHFSHAILHLESPESAKGKFSIEQVINNYQSALRVVDEGAPSDSYIVRKPTSPREGVPGGLSHAGGIRWPTTKQSWQYKALIHWIGMHNLAPSRTESAKISASGQ